MSFATSDTHGDTLAPTCPTCGAGIRSALSLSKCGHEDCETVLCSRCAQHCKCGDECGVRCEDHIYPSTLNGALSRPIGVCGDCKDDDFDEVLERQAA